MENKLDSYSGVHPGSNLSQGVINIGYMKLSLYGWLKMCPMAGSLVKERCRGTWTNCHDIFYSISYCEGVFCDTYHLDFSK